MAKKNFSWVIHFDQQEGRGRPPHSTSIEPSVPEVIESSFPDTPTKVSQSVAYMDSPAKPH